MEILDKVQQLKAELDSLRPLDAAVEDRIMQKLRLDWNYHSNKLEGNTYSFGETKMLLLKGLTAGGKPVRDSEEISGHNEAITFIIDSIQQNEPLTEGFIRHLHKLVLVRPFWSPTKTLDGKPGKRLIKVGEYKTEPNNVETMTGEMFYFAEPIETPAKMQELVEWFRSQSKSKKTNPILVATEFHYRFVLIHPFDDGNGRLARLLMNFILMKYGFPPVVIKNEDKDNYIAAIEQANFKILEPFIEYIAQNLISSLDLMIRGANGEDIDEPEDLDKELLLLEKRLLAAKDNIVTSRTKEVRRSKSVIKGVIEDSIVPLMNTFHSRGVKFERFYERSEFKIKLDKTWIDAARFDEAAKSLLENITETSNYITLTYEFYNFKLEADDRHKVTFGFSSHILIQLSEYDTYVVIGWNGRSFGNVDNLEILKRYTEKLSKSEIDKIVRYEINKHINRLFQATSYYESLK